MGVSVAMPSTNGPPFQHSGVHRPCGLWQCIRRRSAGPSRTHKASGHTWRSGTGFGGIQAPNRRYPLRPAQIRELQLTSVKLDLEHNKSMLAMIEASEKGPNKMPNADFRRKEAENAIAKLNSKIKAIQAAAESAPAPANSDRRPPN